MSTGTKRIPRAIREQQMLDSAISVFADLGYRSASMDTIARDAGVSKPMLYLYYGSKEELFSACMTRESGRLIDQLTTAAVAGSGPRDRLEGVVQSFLEYVDQHTDSWNVVYRQSFAEPAFRGEVEKIRSGLVDLTTDLLQQHWGDERGREILSVVATALVGAGEAVADRVAHGTMSTTVAAGVVVELAWRGLAGDPLRDHIGTATATTVTTSEAPPADDSAPGAAAASPVGTPEKPQEHDDDNATTEEQP